MIDTIKTAAAYVRVSDERQEEYSPTSQLKKIQDYCHHNGLVLPPQYIFYDDGISGRSTRNRDRFRDLIGLAKEKDHPIDVILVWKFSRFARNQEESIVYKSMLKKIGVDVVSVSEQLPDGAFGSLVERIIEWMDEYYSINLAAEVRRGMAEKLSRGEPICAPAFGYDIVDKQYVPNADSDTVRAMFAEYLSGRTAKSIATHFSDMGVRTKYGNPLDHRFVLYLLSNPLYIGKLRYSANGRAVSQRSRNSGDIVVVDGNHPPIIDMDTWDKTQARLAEIRARYPKYAKPDAPPAPFALRGVFRCGDCGATLVRVHTKKPSLQCHCYSRGTCKRSHSILIERAEAALLDALGEAAASHTFNVSTPSDADNAPDKETAEILRKIESAEKRLRRAKDAYQAGIDTLEEYGENKRSITATIDALREQLDRVHVPDFSPEQYAARVVSVISMMQDPSLDPALKNEALHSIIDHVDFHVDPRRINVFFKI